MSSLSKGVEMMIVSLTPAKLSVFLCSVLILSANRIKLLKRLIASCTLRQIDIAAQVKLSLRALEKYIRQFKDLGILDVVRTNHARRRTHYVLTSRLSDTGLTEIKKVVPDFSLLPPLSRMAEVDLSSKDIEILEEAAGKLKWEDLVLFCVLWIARTGDYQVRSLSKARLQELTHLSKTQLAKCIETLTGMGLLIKPPHRMSVEFHGQFCYSLTKEPLTVLNREKDNPMISNLRVINPRTGAKPDLDPEVKTLLDTLIKGRIRNTTTHILRSIGLTNPQISATTALRLNIDGLIGFLNEHGAKSLQGFTDLISQLVNAPDYSTPAHIDLPIEVSVQFTLRERLLAYPLGLMWLLRSNMLCKWEDGKLLSEKQVRHRLIAFMDGLGLDTIGSLVNYAIVQHRDATPGRVITDVADKVLRYLKPGELSCSQILEWLATDDSRWTQAISYGPGEEEIFNHCVAKFTSENGKPDSYTINMNALLEAARIAPRLVGYESKKQEPAQADRTKIIDLQQRLKRTGQ